jgi:hypothetical protein
MRNPIIRAKQPTIAFRDVETQAHGPLVRGAAARRWLGGTVLT